MLARPESVAARIAMPGAKYPSSLLSRMRIYRLICNSGRFYSKRARGYWGLGDVSVLTGRQKVSDLAHPALNLPQYPTRIAWKLSLVHGPVGVRLPKKPRAEAPGVIVDSDLKIESQCAALGAAPLPVGDSAGISGRRTFIAEGLELCHCSHDRFPK